MKHSPIFDRPPRTIEQARADLAAKLDRSAGSGKRAALAAQIRGLDAELAIIARRRPHDKP